MNSEFYKKCLNRFGHASIPAQPVAVSSCMTIQPRCISIDFNIILFFCPYEYFHPAARFNRIENNERVHFNLGMLAMDDRNTEEAENWFRRAVHLKHDFRSALFNLALLLADDHRPLEAAPFLNQLVKHHPDHIKGLILLGDIYINNIKDLDAAENVSVDIT